MRKYGMLLSIGLNIFLPLSQGYGDSIAIIGGEGEAPYAAFVSSSGIATEITGDIPEDGDIRVASVSGSGAAIIGGTQNIFFPYIALVSPEGIATEVTAGAVPSGFGTIYAAAINSSGAAIVGGADFGFRSVYAAIVSSSGVATEVSGAGAPVGNGTLYSAAINSSGSAIIGGQDNDNTDAYAALVSSSGSATEISGDGFPVGGGQISSVGINASGAAIIGGQGSSSNPYAALVNSSAVATSITGISVTNGIINAVAINDSGAAIIGGQDNDSGNAYAAVVSSLGVATSITGAGLPLDGGTISTVAINSSGSAIIGGSENVSADPYVALVSSSGETTPITGDGAPGDGGAIYSVGIHDSGAAIIGGSDNAGSLYAAIVSPSGVATRITEVAVPELGSITSVSIAEFQASQQTLLQAVVPTSFGPGSNFANSLFTLSSQILSNHLSFQKANTLRSATPPDKTQQLGIGLLASASDTFPQASSDAKEDSPYPVLQHFSNTTPYTFWIAPLGNYAHQKKEGRTPAVDNWVGGVITAFDYRGIENVVMGLGAAYAYNAAYLSEKAGHAKTNQEFLTLYGSWIRENFYINLALWGGAYQMKNERHSIAGITSKSHIDGWLLNPHLEMSTPFYGKGDWLLIDPFAMVDWASNWQGDIHEKGASGFNLRIGSQYTSLLRSELGVRFYESLPYGWGMFVLQEKGSWVNKLPFHASEVQAIFVGGVSSFGVEIFSNKTQNLGSVQLNAAFFPNDKKYPYGSLNYQGEFGSSFQSHLISLEIGKDF